MKMVLGLMNYVTQQFFANNVRPNTPFGSIQADHVTPYGFLKRSMKNNAIDFLNADKALGLPTVNEAERVHLETLKSEYRNNVSRIMGALIILNEDESQVQPQSSSSSAIANAMSPISKTRHENVDGIEEYVTSFFGEYRAAQENYETSMEDAILRKQNSDHSSNDFKVAQANIGNSIAALSAKKVEFTLTLTEKALKLFNNLKGITYDISGHTANDKISDLHSYFRDHPQYRNLPKEGSGDSVYIAKALAVFDKLKNKERMDSSLISVAISNSFFFPKVVNKIYDQPYNPITAKAATRENSSGELQYQMARHLFLISVCFPFITNLDCKGGKVGVVGAESIESKSQIEVQRKSQRVQSREQSQDWDFDSLKREFVLDQLQRHDIEAEKHQFYCDAVFQLYNDFHAKLEEYVKANFSIKQTKYFDRYKASSIVSSLDQVAYSEQKSSGDEVSIIPFEQLPDQLTNSNTSVLENNFDLFPVPASPNGKQKRVIDELVSVDDSEVELPSNQITAMDSPPKARRLDMPQGTTPNRRPSRKK